MSSDLRPGRALDALIAEKIFKLDPKWFLENTSYHETASCGPRLKYYSTNIMWAWEIVEMMRLWGKHLDLSGATIWEARFTGSSESVIGETTPHAICLAALKTIEQT